MKGDFSRSTFEPRKLYAGVLMQQGRVLLDADWNEQQAIVRHRLRREARDVIGEAGGPLHGAGFEISLHENDDRVTIGSGRYYVDGVLCECDESVRYDRQPFLDVRGDEPEGAGILGHLYYLDTWERNVTAIEDPSLREIALGGADTTTRIQSVWQVRRLAITKRSFVGDASDLRQRERDLYERLRALEGDAGERHTLEAILTDVREIVAIVASSGRRRPTHLEADLERRIDELSEEVHAVEETPPDLEALERLVRELIEAARPSEAQAEQLRRKIRELDRIVDEHVGRIGIVRSLRRLLIEAAQLSPHEFRGHEGHVRATIEELDRAPEFRRRAFEMLDLLRDYERELEQLPIDVHGAEEIEEFEALRRRRSGTLAARTHGGDDPGYHGSDNRLYRVEIHDASDAGTATFKWSRENGAILARILDVAEEDVFVQPPAGDGMALFPVNAFVEVGNSRDDLASMPGEIVQIVDCDLDYGRVTLGKAVKIEPSERGIATLRRWEATDGRALRAVEEGTWFPLEDGIEVTFSRGPYATGDYWLIAARTEDGSIDWPRDDDDPALPRQLEPLGIRHRYAPLALVTSGPQGLRVTDERRFFAPMSRAGAAAEHGQGTAAEAPFTPAARATSPAIHVTAINWHNDDDLNIDLEREGFRIELDRAPDARSVQPQAVVVTAEPYDDGSGRGGPADHTPVVLNGTLGLEDKTIVWRSNAAVNERIIDLRRTWRVHHVLLRVLVKGHAIWVEDRGTLVYLVGRSYHVPATKEGGKTRVGLHLPSEGNERASDFESWSYL